MIFERLKELIAEQFNIEDDAITMETEFKNDLNADSLDLVELSMTIEEEFGTGEIDEELMEKIQTVGDAVKVIQAKTEA